MKTTLILATACLVASLAQAAPIRSGHLQRGRTLAPAYYMVGITPNSMFNPRYFGGYAYANQINDPCFGRYASGSIIPEVAVDNTPDHTYEHRMVAGFPGAYSSTYMLGSSSGNAIGGSFQTTTFTRYNWDGSNPVRIDAVDSQRVDTFDWVDDNTIITTDGTTGNRARLYLVDVTADPFAMTKNTTWNVDGYVTTTTTSVRNVRVGQVYSGYAYYGDYVAASPKFYAINLATGVSTELGSLGALSTGGINTAVERGGYLFLQTPADGIYVYSLTDATTLGSLYTTYTKAELDACTGYASDTQIYGLDVSTDLKTFIIGVAWANVFELCEKFPVLSGNWQRGRVLAPALYLSITPNSMFNPRYLGTNAYANQINDPCFGRYAAGSTLADAVVDNTADHTYEHRMVMGFRGDYSETYMLGSSSGNAIGGSFQTTTFTRYNWDGSNPVRINAVDDQRMDTFDWVDDDTIIATDGTTGNRARLYLVDVTADPFAMTKNTTWNADGYVTTATTSVRNARVGQMYSGYAYYGDYVAASPKFYAINLATGVSTELGSLGALSTGGINTAVERGGYLFLQTPSDGIYVYSLTDATTLGSLYTTYPKAELDACTGYASDTQVYGLDVSPDLSTFIIGVAWANVFELAPAFRSSFSCIGNNMVLSWPSYHSGVVVQSASDLSAGFTDMSPQPAMQVNGDLGIAQIPMGTGALFFRLRQ